MWYYLEDDILVCIWSIESAELNEHLSDDAGRRLPDNITGLEAMLNPNMEELAQIDNETLEVILKTDRNDETSPTSRMCHVLLMLILNVIEIYRVRKKGTNSILAITLTDTVVILAGNVVKVLQN